ncbi:MAG: hypothetical protein HOW73_22845 [Polyangiaceae bacterium]|nr:hypothetical protein [Polyangiaceae bacterium]
MADPASEQSFQMLLEPHRSAITVHCYRLLGSLQDAEEIVQESLLRAWQRQAELRSAGATRSWLYKIATNACLDLLKTRRRRALPHLVGPSTTVAKPFGPASQIVLLATRGGLISQVTRFMSPKLFALFGLATSLTDGGAV